VTRTTAPGRVDGSSRTGRPGRRPAGSHPAPTSASLQAGATGLRCSSPARLLPGQLQYRHAPKRPASAVLPVRSPARYRYSCRAWPREFQSHPGHSPAAAACCTPAPPGSPNPAYGCPRQSAAFAWSTPTLRARPVWFALHFTDFARRGRVAPEAFQVIEFPGCRRHDMDHDVAQIHQHPVAGATAFNAQGTLAGNLDLINDVVRQGFDVAIGGATGDDHEIGHAGTPTHV